MHQNSILLSYLTSLLAQPLTLEQYCIKYGKSDSKNQLSQANTDSSLFMGTPSKSFKYPFSANRFINYGMNGSKDGCTSTPRYKLHKKIFITYSTTLMASKMCA
nr:hypothetical protein Itr_chr11CG03080 [Ipomoea trifida]